MNRQSIRQIFSSPPTLETERLTLRKIRRSDANDMFEYSKDPEVTRYLLWEPHPDKRYTSAYLADVMKRYRDGKFYDWGVILRDEDKMIGTCGFTRFCPDDDSAECGYVLNRSYWGMGIACEALFAVMNFGFTTLSLHRIECRYMIENERSRRVTEKVGMTYEGTLRDAVRVGDRYRTVGVASMLAREFFEKRGYIPNFQR